MEKVHVSFFCIKLVQVCEECQGYLTRVTNKILEDLYEKDPWDALSSVALSRYLRILIPLSLNYSVCRYEHLLSEIVKHLSQIRRETENQKGSSQNLSTLTMNVTTPGLTL